MVEFFRTSDTAYLGYVSPAVLSRDVEVSVDFSDWTDGLIAPEERRRLVNQLFEKVNEEELKGICSGFKTVSFRAKGRNFVLTPQTNIILRIAAWVFRFLKIIKNDSKVEYSITTSYKPAFLHTPALTIQLPESPALKIEELTSKLDKAKAYFDPFTELATTLFQDYEPFHSWKDVKNHPRRDASKYQMVVEEDALVAKPIADEAVCAEHKAAALKKYKEFIEKQFGKEVIARIQTHYDLNFTEMIARHEPLTPEIIYRVNVRTSLVVLGDIERVVWDLKENKPLPERIKQRAKHLPDADTLDIKNVEHFAKLMDLFLLTEDECEKIFTGRTLRGKISSWYTQGDEELFKPWIDQQEFAQTCFKIPRRPSDKAWDCFYEDLAMILCKKHLHQKNPDGSYRVGALIPAPKEMCKPQTYYEVTSMISNSRGILSYTLEPACPNTSLPAIKLYRSTAVSPYNFDGFASFKNDFNPLNSPGYEGSHLLEKPEIDFFKKRTIPVWVGYQYLASKKLNKTRESMEEVYTLLSKANKALSSEIDSKYAKPTLKQFIRKYDSEFMDLIQNVPKSGLRAYYRAWYLLNNCLRHAVQHKYDEKSAPVQYLKAFLDEAAALPQATDEATKLVAMANKLLTWWNWEDTVVEKMGQDKNRDDDLRDAQLIRQVQSYEEDPILKKLQEQISTLDDSEVKTAWEKLNKWNKDIAKYAKDKHENIEQKESKNLDFVGHSLGAACAQRFLVYYTASKGRIPVPGQTISARVFDDPAINDEDNKAFIDFGNEHADLLSALHAKYVIFRRQEAGDVVPQTGETHLGACQTQETKDKTTKWLKFNAAIQKPSSKANHPHIRDSITAHGRMFFDAKQKMGTKLERQVKKEAVMELTNIPSRTVEQDKQLRRLKEELVGDYRSYPFDALRQWEFDYPPNGKIWRELAKLWNLPLPNSIDSLVLERARSYLSAAFRSGFLLKVIPKIMRVFAQLASENPPGDENHGPWRTHSNPKGVLVVTDTD